MCFEQDADRRMSLAVARAEEHGRAELAALAQQSEQRTKAAVTDCPLFTSAAHRTHLGLSCRDANRVFTTIIAMSGQVGAAVAEARQAVSERFRLAPLENCVLPLKYSGNPGDQWRI